MCHFNVLPCACAFLRMQAAAFVRGIDVAISPPSDLVLDVVRAADPAAVQEAQAKLKAHKAAYAASSLAEAGKGFDSIIGSAMRHIDTPATAAGLGNAATPSKIAAMPDEYRKFESSILSTFVNSMLPKETEEVYGKGSAGEFWKSMMAEKMAEEMSKQGGVGIAEQMYSQALARAERNGLNQTTNEHDRSRADRMITDYERQILGVGKTNEG